MFDFVPGTIVTAIVNQNNFIGKVMVVHSLGNPRYQFIERFFLVKKRHYDTYIHASIFIFLFQCHIACPALRENQPCMKVCVAISSGYSIIYIYLSYLAGVFTKTAITKPNNTPLKTW